MQEKRAKMCGACIAQRAAAARLDWSRRLPADVVVDRPGRRRRRRRRLGDACFACTTSTRPHHSHTHRVQRECSLHSLPSRRAFAACRSLLRLLRGTRPQCSPSRVLRVPDPRRAPPSSPRQRPACTPPARPAASTPPHTRTRAREGRARLRARLPELASRVLPPLPLPLPSPTGRPPRRRRPNPPCPARGRRAT
jgi:hypothetical protein